MRVITLTTLGVLSLGLVGASAVAAEPGDALVFDSTLKESLATNGQRSVQVSFAVTNVSALDVTITQVLTSCGCTVAQLPAQPWVLKPGDNGEIGATLSLAGLGGVIAKTITVISSVGSKTLTIKAVVPQAPEQDPGRLARIRNREVAKADRQAVLRNDCARCHVEPAYGKTGRELYVAVCGVCHEAKDRASMVSDLRTVNQDNNAEIWRSFILQGKVASLMPALGQSDGGPLDDRQVNSLVAYLTTDYKHDTIIAVSPPPMAPAPTKPPVPSPPRAVKPPPPPRAPYVTPAARELLSKPKPPPSPTDPNDPAYTSPEEKE